MNQQGIEWGAYEEALGAREAREALGPDATQADWWRACDRGDWLLWQLRKFAKDNPDACESVWPAIQRAINKIVDRAIKRGQQELHDIQAPWASQWMQWASSWLSGEDRSEKSAESAAEAAWLACTAVAAVRLAPRGAAWSTTMAATSARLMARASTWEVSHWESLVSLVGESSWSAAKVEESVKLTAAAMKAARLSEFKLQAGDIHEEIPEWPGGLGQ